MIRADAPTRRVRGAMRREVHGWIGARAHHSGRRASVYPRGRDARVIRGGTLRPDITASPAKCLRSVTGSAATRKMTEPAAVVHFFDERGFDSRSAEHSRPAARVKSIRV